MNIDGFRVFFSPQVPVPQSAKPTFNVSVEALDPLRRGLVPIQISESRDGIVSLNRQRCQLAPALSQVNAAMLARNGKIFGSIYTSIGHTYSRTAHKAQKNPRFDTAFHPAMIPGGSPSGNSPGSASSSGPAGNAGGSSPNPASEKKLSLSSFIPSNPNLGLFLLSPLVPASDNRPALILLTTIQLLLGLNCMTRRVPKFGESRVRQRLTSGLRFSLGSVMIFLSWMEGLRLSVPYDPWAEEAKMWRHWATKNGHNPSWWYGGIMFYDPMSISEWKAKTKAWIGNTIHKLESEEESIQMAAGSDPRPDVLTNIEIGPRSILKPSESNTYGDIYENLFRTNCQKSRDLLDSDTGLGLKNVTALNKAERLDLIMEKKGPVALNENYSKPNIQLGTHTLEDDAEFEMVWANFEPWNELSEETDFDVRLVPRWRCTDESSDEQ